MNEAVESPSVTSNSSISTGPKTFKCQTCNTTYTDKMYFELHKQTHQKDMPVVQIVNLNSGMQVLPQPAHQQQAQQQPQQPIQATQLVIPEDQLANYKRMYGDSQIYAITPVTGYQVIGDNNRAVTVTQAQPSPGQILQSYTQAYVVTPNDGQQLHTLPDQSIEMQQQMHPQQNIQMQQQPQQHQPIQTQIQQQQPAQATLQQQTQQQQQVTVPTSYTPLPRGQRAVINHNKYRPFKCEQCTASFIEADELEEHKKKHTGDGPFTCEDCHFTFMYKSHFRSHITRCMKKRAMMPQPAKPIILPPPQVKRAFPTNQTVNSLKNDVKSGQAHFVTARVNSNSTKQTSKQQAKFNPNNPSFKRIKREKRLDRPFECSECDASFQTDLDLKTHKSKHTGEGPFKCDECRFVFLYRKLYEAHRRRCEKKRKGIPAAISQSPSTSTISMPSPIASEIPQAVVAQPQEVQSQHQEQVQPLQTQQMEPHTVNISASDTVVPFTEPLQMHSNTGQNSVIEMRVIGQNGEIQHLQVPQQAVVEQVLLPGGQTASIGDRQDIKFDVIPIPASAVEGDCVNMSQIMNLIKVKGANQ